MRLHKGDGTTFRAIISILALLGFGKGSSRSLSIGFWFSAYPVIALTILALASQAALFLRGDVIFRFFNAPERGSIFRQHSDAVRCEPGRHEGDVRELQRAVAATAAKLEKEHGTQSSNLRAR